ncbi:Uncharacterized protein C28H8.8 [Toxocara canis]|uniref:Uncharacterized protein C28H8.8 n=1 Tax=Toxocara canis TaxID=6265 RepID=A0A0B2VUR1_TOXCA|nr:Uncharacterized protein C28H8.8 [Toxocara canis]
MMDEISVSDYDEFDDFEDRGSIVALGVRFPERQLHSSSIRTGAGRRSEGSLMPCRSRCIGEAGSDESRPEAGDEQFQEPPVVPEITLELMFTEECPCSLRRITYTEEMRQADQLLFDEYRNCLLRGIRSVSLRGIWSTATNMVKDCENKTGILDLLPLVPLQNRDETKFVLGAPPQLKIGEDCNVVTLGIGKDIGAEQALSKLTYPLCHFYGSDPGIEENMELYSRIGKFYPFAVAATNGTRTASILDDKTGQYKYVNISHIDLISFFRDQVKLKIIDYLLMDVEYAEYDMLPFFLPGDLLDQNDIIVCQWTCEFHTGDEITKIKFGDFMWENLLYGRSSMLQRFEIEYLHPSVIQVYTAPIIFDEMLYECNIPA